MSEDEDTEAYLTLIEEARARNNVNWMAIVRIAMKHAPAETRGVLRTIRATDLDINFYTKRLAGDGD